MDLKNLSMKEKIGQKFMFGVNSHNIDIIIELIKNFCIGGVILYKKNYDNYEEMLSVIKRFKDANKDNKIPLFIAIDQEGGRVNRMPLEINNIKNIYEVSKVSENLVYDVGKVTGKFLMDTGVNMNFAPVVDIYNDSSKVLYKRCFCGDTASVSRNGDSYIKGAMDSGMISVMKHFPGHGISKNDSHFITPYIYDYEEVLNKHILPFENILKAGVDAIMVSHLVIRKLTKGLPASISSYFIKEYLRDKNKFQGLVITDELNMLSRNIFYRFNYLKKAFLSGSDIMLIKIKENSRIDIVFNEFMEIVKSNKDYQEMLDDSVSRIVKIKNKYKISDSTAYEGVNVGEVNQEIDRINDLCLDK